MSKKEKTASETGDQETDDILKEMEEDGETLPDFGDAPEDDDEEESEEEDADESDEEDEDEDSDDDEEEEEESDADDEDDESEEDEEESDDDSEEDDEDEPDDEDEGAAEDRNANKVPVWKRLKDAKRLLKEANEKLESATKGGNKGSKTIDDMAAEMSKKHNVKLEFAKDLLESAASLAAERAGLDPNTKAALDTMVKQSGEHKFWENQNKEFVRDFKSNIAPLAKRDGIDVKKAQAQLQELAFAPEHAKKSTVQLYLEFVVPNKGEKRQGKKTVEGSRPRNHAAPSKRIEEMDGNDIDSMSDEDFDKFSDGLGKTHRSKITHH